MVETNPNGRRRRTVLAGLAGTATALFAGCSGGTGTATPSTDRPTTAASTASATAAAAGGAAETDGGTETTAADDSGGLSEKDTVEARFSIDFDGSGTATVTHEGGDSLEGDSLYLLNDDAGVTTTWGEGTVEAGDSTTVEGSEGDRVRVVYDSERSGRVTLASSGSPPTDGK